MDDDGDNEVIIKCKVWCVLSFVDLVVLCTNSKVKVTNSQRSNGDQILASNTQCNLTSSVSFEEVIRRGDSGRIVDNGRGLLFARKKNDYRSGIVVNLSVALTAMGSIIAYGGLRGNLSKSYFDRVTGLKHELVVRAYNDFWWVAGLFVDGDVFNDDIKLVEKWADTFKPIYEIWKRVEKVPPLHLLIATTCIAVSQLWIYEKATPIDQTLFKKITDELTAPNFTLSTVFSLLNASLPPSINGSDNFDSKFFYEYLKVWLEKENVTIERLMDNPKISSEILRRGTTCLGAFLLGIRYKETGCWDMQNLS